jgi:predicted dehydrogenase
MIWLIGKPKTVFGAYGAKTHNIEVDDNAAATVVFENDVYATIQTSTSIDPGFPGLVNFYGTDGMISIDGNVLKIVKKDGTHEVLNFDKDKVGSANDPTLFAPVPHKRLINDFVEAILHDRKPLVDGYEGIRAIEVIEAIYQSKGEKVINL